MEQWQLDVFVKMKQHGIKQKDLEKKTGFTHSWLNVVLNNRVQLKQPRTQRKIEQALDELIERKQNDR